MGLIRIVTVCFFCAKSLPAFIKRYLYMLIIIIVQIYKPYEYKEFIKSIYLLGSKHSV